jgi:hypothetical protein
VKTWTRRAVAASSSTTATPAPRSLKTTSQWLPPSRAAFAATLPVSSECTRGMRAVVSIASLEVRIAGRYAALGACRAAASALAGTAMVNATAAARRIAAAARIGP